MSLKDTYKVGQRIWYKSFCCYDSSPYAGGEPHEYEITKITEKQMKVKSVDSKWTTEWTVNSEMVTYRCWNSLQEFYHGQFLYFKSKEHSYRVLANEVECKLAELLIKKQEESNDKV